MKAALIIVLVVAALVGLLLTLRTSRSAGMPSAEVMDRANQRAREQAESDKED
jgi:hypothetical protein